MVRARPISAKTVGGKISTGAVLSGLITPKFCGKVRKSCANTHLSFQVIPTHQLHSGRCQAAIHCRRQTHMKNPSEIHLNSSQSETCIRPTGQSDSRYQVTKKFVADNGSPLGTSSNELHCYASK